MFPRFSARLTVVVATLGAIVAQSGPAEACFCAATRRSVPANGAMDVPTNTRILAANANVGELLANGEPVDSVVLTLWRTPLRSMSELFPEDELVPLTEYMVVSGEGMEIARFTTGTRADDRPPSASSIESFRISISEDEPGSSCGSEIVKVDLLVQSDTETAFYDVVFESGGNETSYVLLPRDFDELGSPCGIHVPARGGKTTCVTVTPRDLAGNAASPGTKCVEAGGGGCAMARGHQSGATTLVLVTFVITLTARRRKRRRGLGGRAPSSDCKRAKPMR